MIPISDPDDPNKQIRLNKYDTSLQNEQEEYFSEMRETF